MINPPDSVKKFQSFHDTMVRHFGALENALYAAEVECGGPDDKFGSDMPDCKVCSFFKHGAYCPLHYIREAIGDHVVQHDLTICSDKSCGTCDHKGRQKSFKESCPRVNELLFRGGDLSATTIIEDTKANGCQHHCPKKPAEVS